jgi:hypothetical protein
MQISTSDELKSRVLTQERRSRIARIIFIICLSGGMIAILMLQTYLLVEYRTEASQRAQSLERILKANRNENAKQTRYLQCIAVFFASKDRATRTLVDLDKCSIEQNGQTVVGTLPLPSGDDSQPPAPGPQVDDTPTMAQAPAASPSPTPAPSTPASPAPTPQPAAGPVEVFGLPVCVPLTGVCLSR